MADHQFYKLLERCGLRVPAEFVLGLGWVTPEVDYICRAVEIRRYTYEGLACGGIDADFVDAFALPTELNAGMVEGEGGELADGVLHACGDDEVLGLIVLQDEPHALNIVLSITPVAEGIEVAQVEAVLLALCDACGCESDLAGDESLASAL